MRIDAADQQFETSWIKAVEPANEGWTLTFNNGWSIGCTREACKVPPKVGEACRLYRQGIGYSVRGIAIGGRVYRYQTENEAQVEHEQWCRDLDARRAAEQAQHGAEIAAGKHAPAAFSIRPEARADWDAGLANNTDPYGRRIYTYAADWAAAMERGVAAGLLVSEVAKAASREADTDGITGFMYGAAVSVLAHVWEHGEDLRRWHNLDTQIGIDGQKANVGGGVLNPALLDLGER